MPPEERFSREAIARAAFELVRSRGLEKLTARNVAARLGASTAPVYHHFNSIDELKAEVISMARELLAKYSEVKYTENIFLNIGVGITIFARDEKPLFHALFLRMDADKAGDEKSTADFSRQMARDPRFAKLTDQERFEILLKMAYFTHGYATSIWAGLVDDDSEEAIIGTLRETGGIVIEAALRASGAGSM